jgi:pyridinium-3,5-bisthiocarboxylic acid mononucleotide nickel chelatase
MKILYFDCFSGISGDMAVGALLSAGMPLSHLQQELTKLDLSGYSLSQRTIERSMISAVKFEVTLDAGHHHDGHEHHHHQDDHHYHHSHHHDPNGHHHDHHAHDHHHHEEPHVHTHGLKFSEIVELFANSSLSQITKQRAIAIFKEIAIAEARIHNVSLDHVHFHEVGAIDSIADIASVAIGLEYFGIEECYSRVVPLGAGGMIRTAHGIMPIPTPATLEIMKGYPTELGRVHAEMTTPTGAGIIKALSKGALSQQQAIKPLHIGFGGGTKDFAEAPNLLRIVIGEVNEEASHHFSARDVITQFTTTIDDMTPAELARAQERLFEVGALDAYVRPVFMKKNRAGHELVVIAEPSRQDAILSVLSKETTTIGVRVEQIERRLQPREEATIEHPEFGSVRAKRIGLSGSERIEPEYEEVKRISQEQGLSFRDIFLRLKQR